MKTGLARLRALVSGLCQGAPAVSPLPPTQPTPAPKPAAHAGGVVVINVLGLGGDALEKVLDMVEAECRKLGRNPVLVTDRDELAPFGRRKLIVEQVPDAEALAARAPDLPWRLYRERLFALIGRRWRPAASVSFGRRPEPACLAALEER